MDGFDFLMFILNFWNSMLLTEIEKAMGELFWSDQGLVFIYVKCENLI